MKQKLRSIFDFFKFESKHIKLFLLLYSLIIIFFRNPHFIFQPRFWAEEGAQYFAKAFNNDIFSSLTFTFGGYYHFIASTGTLLASFVDLRLSPFITTAISGFFILIPCLFIILNNTPEWGGNFKKFLGISAIFFTPLSTEHWLTTLGTMYVSPIILFLILSSESGIALNKKSSWRWSERILVAICGLTGPLGVAFLPGFFLKYFFEKSSRSKNNFFVLLLTSSIQVFIYIATRSAYLSNSRFGEKNPLIMFMIFAERNVVLPILGASITTNISKFLINLYENEIIKFYFISFLYFVGVVSFFYVLVKNLKYQFKTPIMVGYLGLVGLILIGAHSDFNKWYSVLDPHIAKRYFYPPNVIIMFLLIATLPSPISISEYFKLKNLLFLLLISFGLINGGKYFGYFESYMVPDVNWTYEIKKWSSIPEYEPKIFPIGWSAPLKQGKIQDLSKQFSNNKRVLFQINNINPSNKQRIAFPLMVSSREINPILCIRWDQRIPFSLKFFFRRELEKSHDILDHEVVFKSEVAEYYLPLNVSSDISLFRLDFESGSPLLEQTKFNIEVTAEGL